MKKLIILFWLLVLSSPFAFAQTYSTLRSTTFFVDSFIFDVNHLPIKDSIEAKMSTKDIVMQYFFVENDTLYARFPEDYQVWETDNPMTGRREPDKVMISCITEEIIPGGGTSTTTWLIRKSNLVGNTRYKIGYTKGPRTLLIMSL